MRTTAILFLATTFGCATVPSYEDQTISGQRYKEGSVLHAYGAAFVLSGLMTAAGSSVGLGLSAAADGPTSGTAVGVGLGGIGVGVVFSAIGAFLVSYGNDKYTPRLPNDTEFKLKLLLRREQLRLSEERPKFKERKNNEQERAY